MKTFTIRMTNESNDNRTVAFPTEIEAGAIIYDLIDDDLAIGSYNSFEAFSNKNIIIKNGAPYSWGRTTDGNYWIYICD